MLKEREGEAEGFEFVSLCSQAMARGGMSDDFQGVGNSGSSSLAMLFSSSCNNGKEN